jgi:ABC-2 type transport system ATP-binding protein
MIGLTDATKRYGSTVVVDHLSFEVRPGEVTGFLGPNGAGKSTTMRMIVGLDAPIAGRVTVDGRPYRELRFPLHHLGALLEAKAMHPGAGPATTCAGSPTPTASADAASTRCSSSSA